MTKIGNQWQVSITVFIFADILPCRSLLWLIWVRDMQGYLIASCHGSIHIIFQYCGCNTTEESHSGQIKVELYKSCTKIHNVFSNKFPSIILHGGTPLRSVLGSLPTTHPLLGVSWAFSACRRPIPIRTNHPVCTYISVLAHLHPSEEVSMGPAQALLTLLLLVAL